jgi:predicted nicotinamide N-methyase
VNDLENESDKFRLNFGRGHPNELRTKTMAGNKHGEKDNEVLNDENPTVMMVALEKETDKATASKQLEKIRIRLRDLQTPAICTGLDLQSIIVSRHASSDAERTQLEIFDNATKKFVEVQPHAKENIVERFGSRVVHMRISSPESCRNACNTDTPLLALTGRFYNWSDDGLFSLGGSRNLYIRQESSRQCDGTGVTVWDGALLLARYLEQRPFLVQNKHVVELGAGCGLVGLSAGALGAASIMLTDLAYVLPILESNLENNRSVLQGAGCHDAMCCLLDWFHPEAFKKAQQKKSIDVLVVADCVWMHDLVEPLFTTIQQIADANTLILISYQQRGRSTHEAFMYYLSKAFHVEEILGSDVGVEKPGVLHLYRCRKRRNF